MAKRVIELATLEDLAEHEVLFRLIQQAEGKLATASSGEEVRQILANDDTFAYGGESGLTGRIITAQLMVKNIPGHDGLPVMMHLRVDPTYSPQLPERKPFVDLQNWGKRFTGIYDTEIEFKVPQHVTIYKQTPGWSLSASHSIYGALFGNIAPTELYNWVVFKSKEHLEVEARNPRSNEPRAEYEPNGPPQSINRNSKVLPIPMALDRVNNHGGNAEYWTIKLRAQDIKWGHGEFERLVNHLGIGKKEKPTYSP